MLICSIAGLTIVALLVPEGMAYAQIAGARVVIVVSTIGETRRAVQLPVVLGPQTLRLTGNVATQAIDARRVT